MMAAPSFGCFAGFRERMEMCDRQGEFCGMWSLE